MRVTNMYLVELAQTATANQQSNVATLSQQVSSGLRVAQPSDDPTAWVEAQREKVQSALNDGTSTAIESANDRLTQTDGALSQVAQIVSQVQSLAVQGANSDMTAASRSEIAQEVTGLFQSAVAAANSQGTDGSYLLSGTAASTQPFDPTTGAYNGNSAGTTVDTDGNQIAPASIAGTALTAASGVDILPTIAQLATALSANNSTAIQSALGALNTAVGQVATARSTAGGMMDTLQSAKSAHDTLSTALQTSISNYVDADSVSAASALATASTALQTSQAVTTRVLSLLESTAATTTT